VIGAGEFGTKCINQVRRTPRLELRGVADPVYDRVVAACDEAGIPERDTEAVEDAGSVGSAVAGGTCALLSDGTRLAAAGLDVVVEATGNPNAGARHAYKALVNGTHVVMATVEADATVGPLLADIAESRGVVYTTAYGDQPALIAELVGWARTCGMDVVAAGRGISSYDANAAIELCAAANATGLPPDSGGLHVPMVPFADAPDRLRPEEDGGILADTGVVDGVVSPPEENRVPGESIADGVFVVVTTPNDDALEFFGIKNRSGAHVSADGDYVAFFRPHHLPGAETTLSIAKAGVSAGHTGTPSEHVADVVAVADQPVPAGTIVGIDYPATDAPITADAVRVDASRSARPVPFTLLDGATVVDGVDEGSTILYEDVDIQPSFLYRLRSIMEELRTKI
jgi:predicted homoserine dehydrogenase-like protein